MEKSKGINNWIPLLSKLVWPVIILIALIVFSTQVSEVYKVVMKSIKEGRAVEFGGFLKLGEAASNIEIRDLSQNEISIENIGGSGGVVRKGSESQLKKTQKELEANPNKTINTLLLLDNITYSTDLIKQYVSTLGLKYAVFVNNGEFDGWISSTTLLAQLPEKDKIVKYAWLKKIIGISDRKLAPTNTAKDVLAKMQDLHLDALPVVDENDQWLFFTTRGEILSRLMTNLMFENEEE